MEMKDSGCHIVNEKLVEEAKAGISNRAELDYLSELFKLLSDPTRMKLVLGAALGMTKSAISHQLKTMKQCSVVKSRREGKNVFYSLHDQHMTDIIALAACHAGHVRPVSEEG